MHSQGWLIPLNSEGGGCAVQLEAQLMLLAKAIRA